MEAIADVEVQSEAPARKRRKLVFEDVETFVFHGVDPEQPAEVNTKKAAKAWAASKGLSVGDWRSCRLTVHGTETVGTCLAHDNCPRRYRCYGNMKDGHLSLQVAAANDCNSAHPRQARRAIKAQQEAQPSVEERERILEACDSLLEEQLKVTPANVVARAGIKIKGSCLRGIVRHRKKMMGGTTPRFKNSAEGFQAFVDERSSGNYPLCFLQTSIAANMFGWIAVIQPLMDWFQELHGKQGFTHWACTTDWTHRVCHLGFQYGFLMAVVHRCLGGSWRRSPLPLVAICGPQEAIHAYKPGFVALRTELTKRGLPLPSSLNGDWFGGGCLEKPWAEVMGLEDTLISDLEHMVRAICTNSKKGKTQASGEPASILDADADVPEAKRPKKKPHLVNIPIGYIVTLIYTLCFAPTAELFSLAWETVRNRLIVAHGEKNWCDYFFSTYFQVSEGETGEGGPKHVACWWIGLACKRIRPGIAPSQQCAEQFFTKAKRDIKHAANNVSEGLQTHQGVVCSIEKAVTLWAAETRQGEEEGTEPLYTLKAADKYVSVQPPSTPDRWMVHSVGHSCKPPGMKPQYLPSIPTILKFLKKKTRREIHEVSQPPRRFFVMAVCRPRALETGLGEKMIKYLRTRDMSALRTLLKEDQILKEENLPEKHWHFNVSKWRELFSQNCVVLVLTQPAGHAHAGTTVYCSCWHNRWKGYCPHAMATEKYLELKKYTQTPLPVAHEVAIDEAAQALQLRPPSRRRSR